MYVRLPSYIYIVSVRTYVRKYYVHVQINKVNKVRKLDMDNNILIVSYHMILTIYYLTY